MAKIASIWFGFGAKDSRSTRLTEDFPDADVCKLEIVESLFVSDRAEVKSPKARETSLLLAMVHAIRLAADAVQRGRDARNA